MHKLALVTFDGLPALHEDDHALVRSLEARGITAHPVIWSDPSVDWSTFDAAVLRSTWDYFHRLPDFLAWAQRVSTATRLYNPPSVIEWNGDKRYLRGLERRGVPTVPTVWREPAEALDLTGIARDTGWSRLVVKPAVSAGAFATLLVEGTSVARVAAEAELEPIGRGRAFLVQPFLSAVEDGEVSLFYFGGRFSHAVNKRPAAGDFRVQEMFGGVATVHRPNLAQLAVAERALAAAAEALAAELLYARVDLLAAEDGQLRLMELEAIEPFLFLAQAPGAADRLAAAVLDRLERDLR